MYPFHRTAIINSQAQDEWRVAFQHVRSSQSLSSARSQTCDYYVNQRIGWKLERWWTVVYVRPIGTTIARSSCSSSSSSFITHARTTSLTRSPSVRFHERASSSSLSNYTGNTPSHCPDRRRRRRLSISVDKTSLLPSVYMHPHTHAHHTHSRTYNLQLSVDARPPRCPEGRSCARACRQANRISASSATPHTRGHLYARFSPTRARLPPIFHRHRRSNAG